MNPSKTFRSKRQKTEILSDSITQRFTGSCRLLCSINVDDLIEWISGSSDVIATWHKGPDRPLVVVDPLFLQGKPDRVIDELLVRFPGCQATSVSITLINPGDFVPTHTDTCTPEWMARVHVPILSNDKSWFDIDGERVKMDVGYAYLFNPSKPHSLGNDGDTNRVHLMFDVVK